MFLDGELELSHDSIDDLLGIEYNKIMTQKSISAWKILRVN